MLAMSLKGKIAFVVAILITVVLTAAGGVWLWEVLAAYVAPKNATGRKDLIQVFALLIAGVVGVVGAAIGLVNLYFSRQNLEHNQATLLQQRKVEEGRAQDAALQAYFQQMGTLLTEHNLKQTEREDVLLLGRAQTLVVLGRVDGRRKGDVVLFLYGAGLIDQDSTIVNLAGADSSGADLRGAHIVRAELRSVDLTHADLSEADLSSANLSDASLHCCTLHRAILANTRLVGANLDAANLSFAKLNSANVSKANLSSADLTEASFRGAAMGSANLSNVVLSGTYLFDADLRGANLRGAKYATEKQLGTCKTLKKATMPDGSKHN